MQFHDIKEKANKIYQDRSIPSTEIVDFDGHVLQHPDLRLLGKADLMKERELVTKRLFKVKNLENITDFVNHNWDFAAELYNQNNGNIGPIVDLYETRMEELIDAYYIVTRPIKNFLLDEKVGKFIYKEYQQTHSKLIFLLCYSHLYHFNKVLRNQQEINNLFSDEDHIKNLSINIDFIIQGGIGESDYLNECIKRGKDIVLKKFDISSKLDGISEVLEFTLFDISKKSIGKVAKWRQLKDEEKKRIKGNPNQGGRPYDFDKHDTEKWFKELRNDPDYQRSKGRPNISKITQEIISRHHKKTGDKPSKDTIDNHRRKLGLMQK